jgi:hypothetical protein
MDAITEILFQDTNSQIKIPKYIEELLPRLWPATTNEYNGDMNGYYWILKVKYPYGRNIRFGEDADKLLKWARRNYAHAELIEYRGEQKRNRPSTEIAILIITDPVALRLERLKEQTHTRKQNV